MDKGKRPAYPAEPLHLTDLPIETQSNIIEYVSRKDLLNIQCVNKHFRALANAVIYRALDLTLTNSGDDESGLPLSHAADAIHTILTNDESNYGQYIKSFRIGVAEDILDPGTSLSNSLRQDPLLMTRLLWDSKSDSSKFLNTSLLLVIRQASMLETFQWVIPHGKYSLQRGICLLSYRWDAPIELSGMLYQALHKISSLRHLRVRLDVTPSPKMVIRHGNPPGSHPPPPPAGLPPPAFIQAPLGIPSANLIAGPSSIYPTQPSTTKMSNVKRKKIGGSGAGNYWANGRAFSGFKTLNSLALMGISSLECLVEVAECIKGSSSSLKSLTMSLSTDLARKARKPVPVNPDVDDPSDTELDEDDILNDPMQSSNSTTTQQQPVTNDADIRKEKIAQDSILARVFDLQSFAVEGKRIEGLLNDSASTQKTEHSQYIAKKAWAMRQALLDTPMTDGGASLHPNRLEQLRIIRECADMYITYAAMQKTLPKDSKSLGLSPKYSEPKAPCKSKAGLKTAETGSTTVSNISKLMDPDPSTISSPTTPSFQPDPQAKDFIPSNSSIMNVPTSSKFKNDYEELKENLISQHAMKDQAEKEDKPKKNCLFEGHPADLEKLHAESMSYTPTSSSYIPASGPYQSSHGQSQYSSPKFDPKMTFGTGTVPINWSMEGPQHPFTEAQNHIAGSKSMKSGKNESPSAYINTNQSNSFILTEAGCNGSLPSAEASISDNIVATAVESNFMPQGIPPAQQPIFPADPLSAPIEEMIDVDMDHPDEEATDLGQDQEFVAVSDESETATPRKRAKIAKIVPQITAGHGSSSSASSGSLLVPKTVDLDDRVQSYIRATHGLQLEQLSLEWIPLKGSIIARALDLRVLKRITFLEVGPQDLFWTLLLRLQLGSKDIAFKSIHTDNMSQPFVKFLATFEGLEELYIHERGGKQEPDPTEATPITIREIRKSGLKGHISTLKRLMIKNEKSDKWDVDQKTVDFLAKEGKRLKELAISLNMKTYVRPLFPKGILANDSSIVSCRSLLVSHPSMPYTLSIFAPQTAA